MRYLIVQGGGFYGVNIRIISEDTAQALQSKYEMILETDGSMQTTVDVDYLREGMFSVVITPELTDMSKSAGYDTGAWDAGERLIGEMMARIGE